MTLMVTQTSKKVIKMISERIFFFLLCDSMMKDAKAWELLSKTDHKHSIYVRRFSGAKVKSMKVYAKACVTVENPDHIIIQVGINELNSKSIPEKVAKSFSILRKVWFLRKERLQFLES